MFQSTNQMMCFLLVNDGEWSINQTFYHWNRKGGRAVGPIQKLLEIWWIPSRVTFKKLLKMAIYCWLNHWKWWFSILMIYTYVNVYQRVNQQSSELACVSIIFMEFFRTEERMNHHKVTCVNHTSPLMGQGRMFSESPNHTWGIYTSHDSPRIHVSMVYIC